MASPRLDRVDFGLTYGGLRADPTHRATFVIPNRDAIHEKPLVSAAALFGSMGQPGLGGPRATGMGFVNVNWQY